MEESQELTPFWKQSFTTTDFLNLAGIVRREAHDMVKKAQLAPTVAPYGKGTKFIFTWDDYWKIRGKSKKFKKLKCKIKTIINAKGGVGKTALTTLLVHEACYQGYRVLAIDLDPQGQLTYNLGLDSYEGPTLRDALEENGNIKPLGLKSVISSINPFLDIVPSCLSFNGFEFVLKNRLCGGGELVLTSLLADCQDEYDLIVIDTNPYVNLTFVNALLASNHIIIPALTDFNSHLSLRYMISVLESVFSKREMPLTQIVANGYDVRNNISKEALNEMRVHFGHLMSEAKIRSSTDIPQAHKNQQSLWQYKKTANVYEDVRSFIEEILQ